MNEVIVEEDFAKDTIKVRVNGEILKNVAGEDCTFANSFAAAIAGAKEVDRQRAAKERGLTSMSTRHFNRLTEKEQEALVLLAEEASEVVQAVTKILRHGLDSNHPESGYYNRDELNKEVGDIQAAIELVVREGMLSFVSINHAKRDKLKRVEQFLHHVEVDESTLPRGVASEGENHG